MALHKESKVVTLPVGQDPLRLGPDEWLVLGDYPDGIKTVRELVRALTHGEVELTDKATVKELEEIVASMNAKLAKTIPELCESWLQKHELTEDQFRLFAARLNFGTDLTQLAKDVSISIRDLGELRFSGEVVDDLLGSVMHVYRDRLLSVFIVLDLENGIVLSVDEMVEGIKDAVRRARIHRLLIDSHLSPGIDGFPCRAETEYQPSELKEIVILNAERILDLHLATLLMGEDTNLYATIMSKVLENVPVLKGATADFIEIADLADTRALLFFVHYVLDT